ncbi:C6 transcription factor [Neofusicoccum parvum]|uniref:C6 transcription factor n=1 Tax=Neofusicoccum parvum TaxID=310453 RepID=A0ACB5SIL3_9PEZI|nr:C6 transcription factor [Neofusicoccum parvum]
MAAEMFGPHPPQYGVRFSISSSSSQASPSSSESPRTTPSVIDFQYLPDPNSIDRVVPKIEELDDDDDSSKISPLTEESAPSPDRAVVKRPRGRPRKHPIAQPTSITKPPKGRSKTGCITCRRRKKKCDETKPACLHCQKNNVHCEGYPPKEFWKSGKQRTVPARRSSSVVSVGLPVLIDGIETEIDRKFLDHFHYNVSRVLSLFDDVGGNPFTKILIPMAIRHRGLMHSLLCLAGSHVLLREKKPEYENRQAYHFDHAIRNLRTDENMQRRFSGDDTAVIDDPTVAQTLILCLKSVTAGETDGSYRAHMDAARHLIQNQQSPNKDFQAFLVEFFVYHDVANSVTATDRRSILMMDDFHLPDYMIQPEAATLLGVVDGLFRIISNIRKLRDKIRQKRSQGISPPVDYEILNDAVAIDQELREWRCQQEDEYRYYTSMLYQACTWIYLHRTIKPSRPDEGLHDAVNRGLEYLSKLPPTSNTQSVLLMPLFLLGCAAFDPVQRKPITEGFDSLQAYSNLGNIPYAREVVNTVWDMMDAGNEESWDWETIIVNKGWDFLVT